MERRDFLNCAVLTTLAAGTGVAHAGAQTTAKSAQTKGVRITVLKHAVQTEFQKYRGSEIKPCTVVQDGQQFVAEQPWNKPQGMCDWAWADIRVYLPFLFAGQWEQTVACCSDGFRPVFFRLERLT